MCAQCCNSLGICQSFSKPFTEILFPYLPFKFLARFSFPQLALPPQQLSINYRWVFLTKVLGIGFSCRVSSELQSGQMTTMPCEQGFSRELEDRSNRDNALGMGLFFEEPQTWPAHPVVASLLVFKVTVDLSKGRWEQFKLQCHKPCSVRFSSFSWINTPRIVGSLWLISRVLKKLILDIFANVFTAFTEEWIYRHQILKT